MSKSQQHYIFKMEGVEVFGKKYKKKFTHVGGYMQEFISNYLRTSISWFSYYPPSYGSHRIFTPTFCVKCVDLVPLR